MNNSMKKILLIIVFISSLFIITGCGNKKTVDVETFTKIAKDQGYKVVDVSEQYSSYSYIKSGTAAKASEKWHIEFYILEDKVGAINMYNVNKDKFNEQKSDSKTYSEKAFYNYNKYTLKANGQYMYLSRIDNTLLYCNVQTKYEKAAKKLIKKLGY